MLPIVSDPRFEPHFPPSSRRLRRSAAFLGMLGWIASCGWILVFFLITASLYSALDRFRCQMEACGGEPEGWDLPLVTIFAAPRPLLSDEVDPVWMRQELAVRSWTALSLYVDVVLFGKHPSILALAKSLGPQVTVETEIDSTFLGTPFFHSMIARSQATRTDISILVDPEIIILPDILTTLSYIHKIKSDWFLVSLSRSVSHFPYRLVDNGQHWVHEDGRKIEIKKLQEFLSHNWKESNSSERLLIAWNNVDLPLHEGILPPFLYGKGLHDLWLMNEVLSSETRFIFDASDLAFSFYPERLGLWPNNFSRVSKIDTERIWEFKGNYHLAALYGSLPFQQSNIPNNLYKIVEWLGHYYLVSEAKRTVHPLEGPDQLASHSLEVVLGQEVENPQPITSFLNYWRQKKWKSCAQDISSMSKVNQLFTLKVRKFPVEVSGPIHLPLSLESLLHLVADKDKSIVLGIAGFSYRDMLMSWVCRLRQLGVTNFVVCALDSETYEFSVLQGLPVFKDTLSPRNVSFDDCHFGTECFQRVTKVKSRIVLQILKLGYNVLLSDVDIYWFDNPLPLFLSFGPAILGAQSDEFNETGPINLPRRLNSGFYFARSDPVTIAAMEMVVRHASASSLSEQPSFYDVLCGEGGVNRVGDNQCLEPKTNLTVLFLDRNYFPNGAYKSLWEKNDVRSACQNIGCFILHNNWINGRKRKLERQVLSGLWEYDPSSRLCMQNWYTTKSRK
ncbi:beta-arabinofuranosyltransferase RAY1 [Typha latifolia]|uniref:beta-arabinofuranosyltransferase RAY1 n=1 Tax=Typha latifolia TaxID=4733 RepID=UPI003C2BFD5B